MQWPFRTRVGSRRVNKFRKIDTRKLYLDFLSGTLDPRITFSRGTTATLIDATGKLTYAPNNLVINSEAFDNTSWIKFGTTSVSANAAVAPNGTLTADAITIPSASGIYRNVVATANTSYILSVYLRSETPQTVRLLANSDSGAFTSTTCSLTSSWQRFHVYRVTPVGATFVNLQLDTSSGGIIFAWGAQIEAVTYQTEPSTYNSTSPANLLGFTQEWNNAAWPRVRTSITADALIAPDGTMTADKLVIDTTAAANHSTAQSFPVVSGSTYTFTVFAKAAEFSQINLRFPSQFPTGNVTYDIIAGTTIAVGSVVSSSITDAGNGWYRCALTGLANATGTSSAQIFLAQNGSITISTADGASGVFLWGAQVSNSGSVDTYVYNPNAALTSVAFHGPRFDYDPVTLAAKGLFVEEQRANLIVQSNGFATTPWSTSTAFTVAPNQIVSPDGANNGFKVTLNNNAAANLFQAVTATATSHTYTLYVKQGSGPTVANTFGVRNSTTSTNLGFITLNYSTGTFTGGTTNASNTVTNAGNGWWRIQMVFTSGITIGNSLFVYAMSTTGNGDFAYVYGAQFEAGAFATSYIPTVASQVTRTADIAQITGANFLSWYNQSEAALVTQSSNFSAANFPVVVAINDGTLSNRVQLISSTTTGSRLGVTVGGVTQAEFTFTNYVTGTIASQALAITANNFAGSVNGAVVQTDATGTVPIVTQMQLGVQAGGLNPLNGHIRSISYYPTRLSDAQLQALTA